MKVYLRTFGCRANQYDTEAVRGMLAAEGHAIVGSSADADVAVFNSCAVTAAAEAELRKAVRRAARQQPMLRSIVMGCAAALDSERPASIRIKQLQSVDHVIPGADMSAIAAALGLAPRAAAVLAGVQSGTRALLRIQDGCDQHCTFCATTMARGVNRSRLPDEIVREAAVLADRHPELVITGIHIGTYGDDIGTSLGTLMTRLVRELPAARFRLSSIEATEIDEQVSELLIGSPLHVAPHIHAPLQSGSDRVLRRMGRHWYTSATYSLAIDRLAARMPHLGLGADLIAGFPGETEVDHAATMALAERTPFTYLHVFPFSVRPGTAAARLPDHIGSSFVQRRAAELRELGARKAAAYAARRVGGLADVVVLGTSEKRDGLTGDYLTVVPTDRTLRRGARFTARLAPGPDGLLAHPGDS